MVHKTLNWTDTHENDLYGNKCSLDVKDVGKQDVSSTLLINCDF